ncbi:hypothetical protein [Streptomyces sp. NPDC088360]|uniref:hypothetical protein n=1 Tax=Streptomyces sp. NPDC088360 TaxID=3154515 RepID=UPI00344B261E
MSFRLVPLDERKLAGGPDADLPVRLHIRGWYVEPVDGADVAEIEVRLTSADLTDLLAQGRAAQLTLAQQARRAAERDFLQHEGPTTADVVAEATRLARAEAVARDDVGTLQRVVVGLHELPNEDLPARGGPHAGGVASRNPVGGDEVREGGWDPGLKPFLPPLPRRQPGKGGLKLWRRG